MSMTDNEHACPSHVQYRIVIANHCHCKVLVSAQQSMVLSQGRVSLEQRLGTALQTAILLIISLSLSLSLSFSAVSQIRLS
jgi:hypothetical protein